MQAQSLASSQPSAPSPSHSPPTPIPWSALATERCEVHLHRRCCTEESDPNVYTVRVEHHAGHEDGGCDGKESTLKTTYQLDGKNYPVTGAPDYDSLSAKQINPHTASFTLKKAGKPVGRTSRTVSHDGKQMTSKLSMTSAKGEMTESVLVFDRQ